MTAAKKKKLLPSDYLKKGRTRGPLAVDSRGCDVSPNDPEACKWCMSGAIQAARLDAGTAFRLFDILDGLTNGDFICWNERRSTTNRQVVNKMRLAEKRAGLR